MLSETFIVSYMVDANRQGGRVSRGAAIKFHGPYYMRALHIWPLP